MTVTLPTNQIGRQRRQTVILAFCPPILDRHVAAFDKTGLIEALVERSQEVRQSFARPTVEEPNHRRCWLLRARCERPRSRNSEQRDSQITLADRVSL
jgi:hypothetical protein